MAGPTINSSFFRETPRECGHRKSRGDEEQYGREQPQRDGPWTRVRCRSQPANASYRGNVEQDEIAQSQFAR